MIFPQRRKEPRLGTNLNHVKKHYSRSYVSVFSLRSTDPSPLRRDPLGSRNGRQRLEAAKKEGLVTIYISGYEALLPDFEKEFP